MVTLAEEEPFAAVVKDAFLAVASSSCFEVKVIKILRLLNSKDLKRSNDSKHGAFNGRKYEDLMDHREEIQTDPARWRIENIFAILTDGETFVSYKDELLSIYGRIHTNSIGIRAMYDVGSALYVGISIHDHSCRPDAYYTFEKGIILLRSPSSQIKYSTELNINYIDLTKTTKERKDHLSSHYYFECNCNRCSAEQNDLWEQSGYSECCPDSILLPVSDSEDLKCFKCGRKRNLTKIEILSAYNLNLFKFAKHLLDFSMEKQNPTLMMKYANAVLPVYQYYLATGNPALSYGLQHIATAKLFAAVKQGKSDKTIVELLQKAVEASEISHGPHHLVTQGIRQIMVKNMSFLLQ